MFCGAAEEDRSSKPRRQSWTGKWTIDELSSPDNRYLQTIGRQLQHTDTRIVFISGSDAPQLRELCERARDSASTAEFEEFFVRSKAHQADVAKLQSTWNHCSVEQARDYLQRIDVRVADELSLRSEAYAFAQVLFLYPPDKVCFTLAALVLDSVHRELSRADILTYLGSQGYHLRQVANTREARPSIDAVTQQYLASGRRRLIQGKRMARTETQELLAHLEEQTADCVVTGRAGTGKSGCVAEFVEMLVQQGTPVLAFRLDRIDPVKSTKELGKALGLEESPALLLAAACDGHAHAALVIDQLDSISTASGRTTGFFDAVESLLEEVRALRHRTAIHVVVVCREFDWKNDSRLRKLLHREHAHIAVGVFSLDQVHATLVESGVQHTSLTPRQTALLCLPQNLSLFLDAAFPLDTPPNQSLDLFHRYWQFKRESVATRSVPAADAWVDALQTVVQEMTASQQLFVRRELLDRFDDRYINQMISEGVLTLERHRVGFGHESFFDYCFARQFVSGSRTLVEFLLAGEQHLFRRAQVRQVLQYLHESDPDRFCYELKAVLYHAQVRTHLKDLALAVAAGSATISPQEWALWVELIAPHLQAVTAGQQVSWTLAWRHFYGSPALFEQALQRGMLQQWLTSTSEAMVDLAVSYLRPHEERFSRDVAELLTPFAGRNEVWNRRLVWFMQLVSLDGSREMFDLFLSLLGDGTLDEARGPIAVNSTFWNLTCGLAGKSPGRVCEIVAAWLARQLELAKASGDADGFVSFRHDGFAKEPIHRAVEGAPAAFVQHVLPVVLAVAAWAVDAEKQPPRADRVWPWWMPEDEGSAPKDLALHGLLRALKAVAETDVDAVLATWKRCAPPISRLRICCCLPSTPAMARTSQISLLKRFRFSRGASRPVPWGTRDGIPSRQSARLLHIATRRIERSLKPRCCSMLHRGKRPDMVTSSTGMPGSTFWTPYRRSCVVRVVHRRTGNCKESSGHRTVNRGAARRLCHVSHCGRQACPHE